MKLKFTLALFLLSMFVIAQNTKQFGRNPQNGLVRCTTDEYETELQNKFSDRANKEEFEAWLAPLVAKEKQRMNAQPAGTNVVVTVPVVVHVIHNGDNLGSNENIADARVLSQITVLNQDFRKMLGTNGYNTNPVGADVELEFCMAQQKPDGTATNGIDRVNKGETDWKYRGDVETMKTQTQWDPTKYFNIWVVRFTSNSSYTVETGGTYGLLGYAQFPSSSNLGGLSSYGGEANTDGVVIDFRAFGSKSIANVGLYYTSYESGRTTTHEVGHCFGLRHIWGDNTSCTITATDSDKDYCPDTPAASQANYDCDAVYNSCPSATGNDMTENYMDYTNDTCMNVFTVDQKSRVLAVLNNSPRRKELKTSIACQAPLANPDMGALENVSLYPNPANDKFTLTETNIIPDEISIYNTLGQVVFNKKVTTANDLSVSVINYPKGTYLVKVNKGSAYKVFKLVKD